MIRWLYAQTYLGYINIYQSHIQQNDNTEISVLYLVNYLSVLYGDNYWWILSALNESYFREAYIW